MLALYIVLGLVGAVLVVSTGFKLDNARINRQVMSGKRDLFSTAPPDREPARAKFHKAA